MTKFTAAQPKAGQTVLGCAHATLSDAVDGMHFFQMGDDKGLTSHRINVETGAVEPFVAHWLVCCHDCFLAAEGDHTKIEIAGVGTWQGDEPTILKGS